MTFNRDTSLFSSLEQAHRALESHMMQLQSKLEGSLQTLEQIVAHLSEGLIFINREGEIALFNESAARLTGYTQKEALGKSYQLLFSDALFGFSMQEALTNGKKPSLMRLSLSDDVSTKEVEISSSYIPEQGVLLLVRDLTQLIRLEQAVARGERLKEIGEMAATLAHEIRNPLGGIEGFASLLAQDLKGDPEKSRMLDAIITGTRTLNSLVTHVLQFARPLKMHLAPTDLVPLIQETCALVTAPCHFKIELATCTISADREHLKRALLNLFRNAAEATPGDPITITLTQKEGACLTVSDSGPGIPEELQEKIFTPFFTTKTDGTGLGLPEVYKIVQAHGGKVEVDSKIGEGTRCTLRLPQ